MIRLEYASDPNAEWSYNPLPYLTIVVGGAAVAWGFLAVAHVCVVAAVGLLCAAYICGRIYQEKCGKMEYDRSAYTVATALVAYLVVCLLETVTSPGFTSVSIMLLMLFAVLMPLVEKRPQLVH